MSKLILKSVIENDKMRILKSRMKEVVKIPNDYKRINCKTSVHENNSNKNVAHLIDQLLVYISSSSTGCDVSYMAGERAIQTRKGISNMDIAIHEKT